MKYVVFICIGIVAIVLDHVTKAWAKTLELKAGGISVIDGFFRFVYAENPGAAWGLFRDINATWRVPFFVFVSIVAMVLILAFLRMVEKNDRWMITAMAFVWGGAMGNFIDRISYGYVIDFVELYYKTFSWPVFNVADIFISAGVIMMALGMLFGSGSLSLRTAHQLNKEQAALDEHAKRSQRADV